MDITNRLYPYPVLSPLNDSVPNSSFDIGVTSEIAPDKSTLTLSFDFSLKDKALKALIEAGKVGIIVHVECPRTTFRQVYQIPIANCIEVSEDELKGSSSEEILSTLVSGKLEICPFLVALDDFTYKSDTFNSYYGGAAFDIDVGSIVAEGLQKNLVVEIARTRLQAQNSIFVTILAEDPKQTTMSVNIDGDRITILMPKQMFDSYGKLKKSSTENDSILWSLIIIPAFVSTLEQVKKYRELNGYEIEELSTRRWYRSINKALKTKLGYGFDSDTFLKSDMVEVAQTIIGNPLGSVLNEMTTSGASEDEENL